MAASSWARAASSFALASPLPTASTPAGALGLTRTPCPAIGFQHQQRRWASSKKGGSSARYLARQKNDIYVKGRQQGSASFGPKSKGTKGQTTGYEGFDDVEPAPADGGAHYISRSAFKLAQLDDRYRFLRGSNKVVVDLGATPGGWTQVIVERLLGRRRFKESEGSPATSVVDSETEKGASRIKPAGRRKERVFALDILPMQPVEGAVTMRGNFLDPAVQRELEKLVSGSGGDEAIRSRGGFVDVVVSDMMANTTGNPIADTEASLELCRAALDFALATLKVDREAAPPPSSSGEERTKKKKALQSASSSQSVLVMKYFMSAEADRFRKQELERFFRFVKAEKMESSRKESREQFWVCRGFRGRGGGGVDDDLLAIGGGR